MMRPFILAFLLFCVVCNLQVVKGAACALDAGSFHDYTSTTITTGALDFLTATAPPIGGGPIEPTPIGPVPIAAVTNDYSEVNLNVKLPNSSVIPYEIKLTTSMTLGQVSVGDGSLSSTFAIEGTNVDIVGSSDCNIVRPGSNLKLTNGQLFVRTGLDIQGNFTMNGGTLSGSSTRTDGITMVKTNGGYRFQEPPKIQGVSSFNGGAFRFDSGMKVEGGAALTIQNDATFGVTSASATTLIDGGSQVEIQKSQFSLMGSEVKLQNSAALKFTDNVNFQSGGTISVTTGCNMQVKSTSKVTTADATSINNVRGTVQVASGGDLGLGSGTITNGGTFSVLGKISGSSLVADGMGSVSNNVVTTVSAGGVVNVDLVDVKNLATTNIEGTVNTVQFKTSQTTTNIDGTVNALNNDLTGKVDVNGGTLELGSTATVTTNIFSLQAGVSNCQGTIDTKDLQFKSGTFTAKTGAKVTATGVLQQVSGSAAATNIYVEENASFNTNGVLVSGGTLNINGPIDVTNTVSVSNGALNVKSDVTLTDISQSGGSTTIESNVVGSGEISVGSGTFTIAGNGRVESTKLTQTGAASTTVQGAFYGDIQQNAGTLTIGVDGAVFADTFNIGAGTTQLDGLVNVTGKVSISGGSVEVNSDSFTASGISISAGAATVKKSVGTGDVTISSGNLLVNDQVSLGVSTFTATGGTTSLQGQLSSDGDVKVGGTSFTVETTGKIQTSTKLTFGTGTTTVKGDVLVSNEVQFDSNTVTIQSGASLTGSSILHNTGTTTIQGTATVTNTVAVNGGTFHIDTNGQLEAASLAVSFGSATVSGKVKSNSGLSVNGGSFTLNSNAQFETIGGGSSLDISGGSVTFNDNTAATFNSVSQTNGVFNVHGSVVAASGMSLGGGFTVETSGTVNSTDVQVAGTANIKGSVIASGELKLGTGGSLTVASGSSVKADTYKHEAGDAVIQGSLESNNEVVVSSGSLSLMSGGKVTASGGVSAAAGTIITIEGELFTQSFNSAGTTTISGKVSSGVFTNSGIFGFGKSGATVESSNFENSGTLFGGEGTISGDLTNKGTVRGTEENPTTINTSNYNSTEDSTLNTQIVDGQTTLVVNSDGSAQLGGTLVINFSGNTPSSGETTLMTFQNSQGEFSNIEVSGSLQAQDKGCSWDLRQDQRALVLVFSGGNCQNNNTTDSNFGGLGLAGLIALIVVGVLVVVLIALILGIPKLRRAVLPFRDRAETMHHRRALTQEFNKEKENSSNSDKSSSS